MPLFALRQAWDQASQQEREIFLREVSGKGRKHKDITGQRFGRLTAIRVERDAGGHLIWVLKCDCGNTHKARLGVLAKGDVRSCGCLLAERNARMTVKFRASENRSLLTRGFSHEDQD